MSKRKTAILRAVRPRTLTEQETELLLKCPPDDPAFAVRDYFGRAWIIQFENPNAAKDAIRCIEQAIKDCKKRLRKRVREMKERTLSA